MLELLVDLELDLLQDIIPSLIDLGVVESKSEFLKFIKQGEVQIDGEKLLYDDLQRVLINNEVMKIGKKKFVKFIK